VAICLIIDFLETPHRLLDSLEDLDAILGDRQIALARELTKLHEEIWRGKPATRAGISNQPAREFVLVVAGKMKEAEEK